MDATEPPLKSRQADYPGNGFEREEKSACLKNKALKPVLTYYEHMLIMPS
jgi:hypothetical protein